MINGREVEMFGEEYDVSIRVMQNCFSLMNRALLERLTGSNLCFSIDVSTGPQGELITKMSQPVLIITIDSWITDNDFNTITSFRCVFTPDKRTGTYKLNAQIQVNFTLTFLYVVNVNNSGPLPMNLTIIYNIDPSFIMKGARPIHVYTDVGLGHLKRYNNSISKNYLNPFFL